VTNSVFLLFVDRIKSFQILPECIKYLWQQYSHCLFHCWQWRTFKLSFKYVHSCAC